jgi:hypothetical protein
LIAQVAAADGRETHQTGTFGVRASGERGGKATVEQEIFALVEEGRSRQEPFGERLALPAA